MEKNPVFILCPGRSFSSVVCGMLGVHPELYGLPEVNIFLADTVGGMFQKAQAMRMKRMFVDGLHRVIAQLHSGEQSEAAVEEAIAWVEARMHWPSARMYRYIARHVAPKRCVDKSPAYSSKLETLNRIRECYPDALFLHLGRHPRPAGISLFNAFKGRAESRRLRGRLYAEMVEERWTSAQITILEFARTLPVDQYVYLRGEDLLNDPAAFLPQIAEWIGVSSDASSIEAMMHPEKSPYACVGPENALGGNNPGFLKDPELRLKTIKSSSLDGPLEWMDSGAGFSAQTREIAHMLGYT